MSVACAAYGRSYYGLLAMRRIASRYTSCLGFADERYDVLQPVAQAIREHQDNQVVNLALDVARFSRPTDFSVRVLCGRISELEHGSYPSELYDPGELPAGVEAYEVYRRGTMMQATGNIKEAERMYVHAIAAEPAFALALRGYADVVRERDPARAAIYYSGALDHMPRLVYGSASADGIKVLGVHRNFLLTMRGREYVAVPLDMGHVDLSSPALKWPSRRFAGLLLMRLRLRARTERPNASVSHATFEPVFLNPPEPLSPAAPEPVAADIVEPVPLEIPQRVVPDTPEPRPVIGPMLEKYLGPDIRRFLRSMAIKVLDASFRIKYSLRRNAHLFQFKQVVRRNAHLFQFALLGSSMQDLMEQIDRVDRLWLSRTERNDGRALA
jgi:hypothetical protein